MRDTDPNKFVAFLAIIATPFALGAFLLTWAPAGQYANEDPAGDGYVPPRSIQNLVDRTQESTVTVWCEPAVGMNSMGSAFAIELETDVSDEYPTTLITNHHVIEDCIGVEHELLIALPYQDKEEAVIVKWDEENDIAVIATKKKLPALGLSENATWPGYWVMAVGSADGYEGSVAFGNVLNVSYNDILTRAEVLLTEDKDNKALQNLLSGKTKSGIFEKEFFQVNEQIVDLDNPLLTDEDKEEIVSIVTEKLDIEGRSYKNLIKYMVEDGLFKYLPKGDDAWTYFIQPFMKLTRKEKTKTNKK